MLKTLLLLFLCTLLSATYADITPITISPDQGVYEIRNYSQVFHDRSNKLTLPEISLSPFSTYDYQLFPKYRNLTTWLKFKIYNPLSYPVILFLNQERNLDKGWELYSQNNSGIFFKIDSYPTYFVLFPLKIEPNATEIFYLKRFTEGKNEASNFKLTNPFNYILISNDHSLLVGFALGIPLALLIHSLFIFILVRDKNYLIYILFIISYLVVSILDFGLLNRIPGLPLNNWWYLHITETAITTTGFFYILFAKNVLRAKEYAPLLNRLMYFMLVIAPFFIFYSLALKADERVMLMYALVGTLLAAMLNIVTLFKGYKPAKYYLLGMISVLIGTFVLILMHQGIIIRNILSEFAVHIGIGFDMIFQAIALAARFNLIKEEEAKVQAALIQQKDVTARVQATAITKQQQIITAYERFVPHDFLYLLRKKSIVNIQLGDQVEKHMAVLFADIRNFTTIIEETTPTDSIKFINHYLGKVGPIIRSQSGFVDKYIGDAIMALFQSPSDPIYAAIKMINTLSKIGIGVQNNEHKLLEIGIAIHYGPVMLGTVGEKKRMDGTVISDVVNTAARLEGLNKLYKSHIIISEEIYQLIKQKKFHVRFIDHVYLKGKTRDIKIYEVFDADSVEVIEKKIAINHDFEKAIELYQKQNFEEAIVYLRRCQRILPEDFIVNMYIKRCEKLYTQGVSKDWQPIIRLLQKDELDF